MNLNTWIFSIRTKKHCAYIFDVGIVLLHVAHTLCSRRKLCRQRGARTNIWCTDGTWKIMIRCSFTGFNLFALKVVFWMCEACSEMNYRIAAYDPNPQKSGYAMSGTMSAERWWWIKMRTWHRITRMYTCKYRLLYAIETHTDLYAQISHFECFSLLLFVSNTCCIVASNCKLFAFQIIRERYSRM